MKYFISDLHIGHYNVISYAKRNFPYYVIKDLDIIDEHSDFKETFTNMEDLAKRFGSLKYESLKAMEDTIVKNWNDRINEEDEVYIVGDVAYGSIEAASKFLKRLKGKKILIKGNHDKKVKKCQEFAEVHDSLLVDLGKYKIRLNHYPYVNTNLSKVALNRPNILTFKKGVENKTIPDGYKEKIKFLKWHSLCIDNTDEKYVKDMLRLISALIGTRLINEGEVLGHGHTHSYVKRKFNMINFCVEAWDLKPASEAEVIALIDEWEAFKNISIYDLEKDKEKYKDDLEFLDNADKYWTMDKFKNLVTYKEAIESNEFHGVPRGYTNEWYEYCVKKGVFIDKKDLVDGEYYLGYCRNASFARWSEKKNKFTYIRNKFGSKFLEDINHLCDDDGHDLFVPRAIYKPTEEEKNMLKDI